MCQYSSKCPTKKHNPLTRCAYAGRRPNSRILVVGVVVVVAALAIAPRTFSKFSDRSPAPRPRSNDQVKVTRVVDGDTLRVHMDGKNIRVRLLGIDAPEIDHGDSAGECFGARATRELERLTPVGSQVILTSDPSQDDFDKYGRPLRYIERAGVDVNQKLLRRGAAVRYLSSPPLERAAAYDKAEANAKKSQAGLWGSC